MSYRWHVVVVVAACLGTAACSSVPRAGTWRFTSGTAHFEHSLEKLPSGKSRLVVMTVPGLGQSDDAIEQQARRFANEFAASQCPKGYDFFADNPLESGAKSRTARSQRTYVFQCR